MTGVEHPLLAHRTFKIGPITGGKREKGEQAVALRDRYNPSVKSVENVRHFVRSGRSASKTVWSINGYQSNYLSFYSLNCCLYIGAQNAAHVSDHYIPFCSERDSDRRFSGGPA